MDGESDDSDMSINSVEEEQEIISSTISTSTPTETTTAVDHKMKKKKGVFKKDWLNVKEYSSWLQEVKNDQTQVRCKACLKSFSVRCDGKTAHKKHMNSDFHKTCMKSFSNKPMIVHYAPTISELQKVSATEATLVYPGVRHGHSYISQQCTINLVKNLFETTSTITKSLSCARTKSRAIACNVLAPYFTRQKVNEILEARFYSISFDASNKGNVKTYPFVVQYFSDIGVKRGLLDFIEDSRETALDIFNNTIKAIENHQLQIQNLTSIGADNTNVNFENVLVDIQRAELKLQHEHTTAVDLYRIISDLIKKLEQRLDDHYFGNKAYMILNSLKESDKNKAEELQQSFKSFIKVTIEYINSYFDENRNFYEKLSVFDCHSPRFLKWEYIMDVLDLIKIDDLDKDELYNEYCEIKFMYNNLKNKNVKLNELIKSYILNKNAHNPQSTTYEEENLLCNDSDNEDFLLHDNIGTYENVRSDQLWSYLIDLKGATPNIKKIICYVFSIPCSNAYVESIFSQMNHLWTNYRNRMDIQLVAAELQIRKNSNISCNDFYKYIISQQDLLKAITTNDKYETKKLIFSQ
ncbi:unnamed protein product [Rotaria sordida]|uniref:HAT C-terminal dimerisation domain-containing protein n=1 Tax=Rotaria sordida TaxID=392033 RepID=A0A819WHZ3_9BILA|nr:unnamed protein product [Rotaria sordida]